MHLQSASGCPSPSPLPVFGASRYFGDFLCGNYVWAGERAARAACELTFKCRGRARKTSKPKGPPLIPWSLVEGEVSTVSRRGSSEGEAKRRGGSRGCDGRGTGGRAAARTSGVAGAARGGRRRGAEYLIGWWRAQDAARDGDSRWTLTTLITTPPPRGHHSSATATGADALRFISAVPQPHSPAFTAPPPGRPPRLMPPPFQPKSDPLAPPLHFRLHLHLERH